MNRDTESETPPDDGVDVRDGLPILVERPLTSVKRHDLRTLLIVGSFGLALVLLVALNMR